VDWVVNDTPDSTGTFSGFPTNQLINITVNRIVQSKVANFLKQNQSLGGTDGYFFHVNSYDWRNANAPILPPTTLVGFAVERGITSVAAVSGATNASPIVINTSAPHGLSTGQVTTISGVTGNIAANGTWPIIVTGATTFSLTGSVGSGTYGGSGTVYIPSDMSSLIWDETNNVWRLATIIKNNPGDSVTLGVSQSLKVNNFILDGYIAIGLDPADTGAIRLANNAYIFSESNPTGTDIQLIGADTLNRIKLGVNATDTVYIPGIAVVDGYIQHDGTGSNTAQTTGFIREQNSTNIVAFRGTAALAGSDIVALASSSNNVVLGDSVNTGILYRTSGGSTHQFQTGSNIARVEIGDPFIRFTSNELAPIISQVTSSTVNAGGQTLTVQAQGGGPGTSNGGNLSLASGLGVGTGSHGRVDLLTGSSLQMSVYPDTNAGADNNSILYYQNLFRVDSAQISPVFRQDNTASGSGQTYTVQSQNSIAIGSTGGTLSLTSGTGVTQSGTVLIQTGGVTQIVVSPLTIAPSDPQFGAPTTGTVIIKGNLEVQGTTTTVESTVVDIIGRIIHGNWTDPLTPPSVGPPSQISGYSIHRGNYDSGGGNRAPRDGAAWIWTENQDGYSHAGADGYWRAVTIPGDGIGSDNFSISNSLNIVGVMGNDFSASSDPNPISGYLASAGSLRTANNVPTTVSRNITATTTLDVSATNGIAALPLGTITVVSTTGFTSAGTLLVVSSAGVQTLTYTSTNATQFLGVLGGTGNIVTGGIVGQTNKSTTFNGVNGTPLPIAGGILTVPASGTTGFPTAGTLRVVSRTSNSAISPPSVQIIAYTGLSGGNTFTGCTGGSGFLFVGDAVTSLPATGTQDLVLLGTDFGNRILHGAPTNNTGHIFNTPTGFFYDFQINSVSQIQLRGDIDADSFVKTITIAPTVNTPKIYQVVLPNTGATNGFSLKLQAQAGQQQTGGNANNNGGALVLASGAAGTGGGGAAGIHGTVDIQTDAQLKIRIFPTDASPVGSSGDDNSILYFESLFRVDAAQTGAGPLTGTGIRFRQDDTGGTGAVYTIQAQNSTATTGGNIVITSGSGNTTANAGKVQLQTGAIDRVVSYPTNSPTGLPSPATSNVPYTEFRDAGQGLFIVPVSAGTTSIGFATTVTTAQIAQVQTTTTIGAPMIVQSQVTTLNGSTGGNLSLIAGNATGTTTTGGNAILSSGTGTTVAGNVQLQTGGVDKQIVHPTFNEFRDTAEALRITPVSAGTTQITFAATDTAAQINQTQTASTPSAPMTIQSQTTTAAGGQGGNITINGGNATGTTSTGGNAIVTSGTGTTVAGNVQLQTGTTDRVVVHPTFTEFRDAAEAFRITPVSAGTTQLTFAATDTAVQINQTTTAATPSANMTIQSQVTSAVSGQGGSLSVIAGNATNTTSNGGALNLASGTGTSTNGTVNLQPGGVTTASVVTNKFVLNKGWRRNVTAISTTYQVLVTDDYIAATTNAPYTATMPTSPTTGDAYTFKDVSGGAGTNTLTISGNGNNIDGNASIVLNQAFAAVTLTFTGSQWSVT
jgi:hypothetical protein